MWGEIDIKKFQFVRIFVMASLLVLEYNFQGMDYFVIIQEINRILINFNSSVDSQPYWTLSLLELFIKTI